MGLEADWSRAAEALLQQGWVRLSQVLPASLADVLLGAAPPVVRRLPEVEGVVHQAGYTAYSAFQTAHQTVRELGGDLVEGLNSALPDHLPRIPRFNEVTWTRYPDGEGHITVHRDPDAFDGVVVVATLRGSAPFRVWAGSEGWPDPAAPPDEAWTTAPGDLVVLAGRGWPVPEGRGPRHAAGPPVGGDRVIMTLRHNTRGAGAGYDVGPPRYRPGP